MKLKKLTRRRFVIHSSAVVTGTLFTAQWPRLHAAKAAGPFQAMGTRVGEVTDGTAVVWTRLTAWPVRSEGSGSMPSNLDGGAIGQMEGACPGAPGRVQVRYGTRKNMTDSKVTVCETASEENDFITHFKLTGLKPGTVYHYVSEIIGPTGLPQKTTFGGKFETSPAVDTPSNIRFCVMTCQGYHDRGHIDGHHIYPAMLALKPQFTCLTGDLVYYDNDKPRAVTARLARYHWERMFSLPRLIEFSRNNSAYWLKDDHDTLENDSWPGVKAGEFTFEEGQRIFRQQAPMGDGQPYRTVRWGRDLQLWFAEGRDFRSPNTMPDGPSKTIWGAEQKAWFKRTVQESKATWKVLVSPTPLVGPDRPTGKNDNHANVGFVHEGDELRSWILENVPGNFFVICGDRHWQYHSVHPVTRLHEFSVGAASDEHAAGSPGENPRYHVFHRVKGGFLSVTLKSHKAKSRIQFEHRDVHGMVVHAWSQEAPRRL